MKDLVSKFSIYDHFGYLLVGLYQITVLYLLVIIFKNQDIGSLSDFFKAEYLLSITLFSYLIGHLIQAVTNLFSKWEKIKKEEKNKELDFITDKAVDFFKLPKNTSNKIIFQYCYLYSLANDFSGHIKLFNSMYSLYRGLFVSSIISGIVGIGLNVYLWSFNWQLLVFIIFMIGATLLFRNRVQRFFAYTNTKTMITFDILSKNLLK